MTTLTIRNVDAAIKERLRVSAARNGRSMEAELRQILSDTLAPESSREPNLAEAIRRRFAPWEASTSTFTRQCRSASRRNLTSDRSRYQCHFRIDAAAAASGSAGLGGGATTCDALHDRHQSDRDPLRARISVCHGVGGMFAASSTIIMSNDGA